MLCLVLVVMDDISVDQDQYFLGRRDETCVLGHSNPRAAPAGNLHVGNFDVDAPSDADAVILGALLAEVRAVEPEAGDANATNRIRVVAVDFEEVAGRVIVTPMLTVSEHGP